MTLLLIIPAWVLLLGLVVGLCTAARIGDTLESRELPATGADWMTDSAPDDNPRLGSRDVERSTAPAALRGGRLPARNVAA
jgi:hypothetical protein